MSKINRDEAKNAVRNLLQWIERSEPDSAVREGLVDTPERVVSMFDEIFSGLNPKNKPKVALFDNKYQYRQMLVEKSITFYSNCEHDFVPIIGKAHIANVSSGKGIGLSRWNGIVQYYA